MGVNDESVVVAAADKRVCSLLGLSVRCKKVGFVGHEQGGGVATYSETMKVAGVLNALTIPSTSDMSVLLYNFIGW